jgi:hypothetical protein
MDDMDAFVVGGGWLGGWNWEKNNPLHQKQQIAGCLLSVEWES